MGKIIKYTIITVALLVAFLTAYIAGVSVGLQNAPTPVIQPTTQAIEQELIELVNEQRTNSGLQPLATENRLMATAKLKTLDMVEHDYFEHERDGTKLYHEIYKIMPECKTTGENLAQTNQTPQDVVNGWMGSPSHRENILSNYQLTGISVEKDITPKGELYIITQHFCTR